MTPAAPVNFALIDATAEGAPQDAQESRYATPIANTPLICHVFSELADAGIGQARIVAPSGLSDGLARIIGNGPDFGISLSYVDASAADGRKMVLAELEQTLAREPVLLHPGDCLLRSQTTTMQQRFSAGDVDLVLPKQACAGQRRSADQRVCDSVVVLGPGTRTVFGELLASRGPHEDLVAALMGTDCRFAVCEQTENWCYSDETHALLAGNRLMLDSLPSSPHMEMYLEAVSPFSEGNQINGRVAISPGASVSNSVLYGPLAIDAGAVVEDSFIGPYTAIGAGAIVSGVEIDNSMVLRQAEVRHPGFRIEGSIIGERCQLVRSFDLPKGLHLRLRAQSRITLS